MRSNYKHPQNTLLDIEHDIALAGSFIAGFTFEEFVKDRRTVSSMSSAWPRRDLSRRLPGRFFVIAWFRRRVIFRRKATN
jgi:hypothetical protein